MLSLVLALSLGQYTQPRIFEQPNLARSRQSGANYAFFEFAPASGAGMGAPCAGLNITGARGEVVTVTRAGVAECYSTDGQTLTQIGNNLPVVMSGANNDSVLGLYVGGTPQNSILWCRDLSNAAWVKTNMMCTKTATGMRNDANGATTCTSTAINGTVLQTIVLGAATRNSSMHLKRRTGVGVVEVTRNNGGTWSAVTASLSTTLWKRVVSTETIGCTGSPSNCIVVAAMTSGGANPVIGLRFGTSGDAVDVDFVQDEAGANATMPIETTTVAVTRVADLVTAPVGAPTVGTFSQASTVSTSKATTQNWMSTLASNVANTIYEGGYNTGGTNLICAINNGTAIVATTANKGQFVGKRFSCVNDATNENGNYDGTGFTLVGTRNVSAVTKLYIGSSFVGGYELDGVIKKVCYQPDDALRCR